MIGAVLSKGSELISLPPLQNNSENEGEKKKDVSLCNFNLDIVSSFAALSASPL